MTQSPRVPVGGSGGASAAARLTPQDLDRLQGAMPALLRERPQWLLWRFVRKPGQDKPAKMPHYCNGELRGWPMGQPRGADGRVARDERWQVHPTPQHPQVDQGHELDRQALCTFDDALAVLRLAPGRWAGLGFAFLPGDGLIGIDVDRAIDAETGEIAPHCAEIISRCGSWTELSPSRTGVHVIVQGETRTFKDNGVGVEVFCGRQFFTMSGHRMSAPGVDVQPLADDVLAWLHEMVKGPDAQVATGSAGAQVLPFAAPNRPAPSATAAASVQAGRYCIAALESAVQRVRHAGEGRRNATLNAETYGVAQLVHTGAISEQTIRLLLGDAARACGLGDAEIQATINSGMRGGLDNPRPIPQRDAPQRPAAATRRPEPPDEGEARAAEPVADSVDDVPPWAAGDDEADGPGVSHPSTEVEAPQAAARVVPGSRPKGGGVGKAVAGGEGATGRAVQVHQLMLQRFALVYATDSAWDAQQAMLVRVQHMRLALGRKVVNEWLEDPQRRTVMPTDLVFEPGQDVAPHQINMFTGLDVAAVPAEPAEVAPMLELLRHLCAESAPTADEVDAVVEWVLRWMALPLQQLGTKMQTALVFHGAQGTGKNLFFDVWRDLYGVYGITVTQTEIEDKFNGWVSRKLAIVGDEVVSRAEMYHNKNRLKLVVTQQSKFAIRGMQQETRWESNHANVVFLSNESQPLALEERDRRYMVVYTPLEADAALYQRVRDFLRAGGAAKWLHYLLTYPLDGFDAHTKPLMTRAKAALIEANWRPAERFASDWLGGYLELPLRPCTNEQLFRAFQVWAQRNGERWPPSQSQFTSQVDRWCNEQRKRDAATGRLGDSRLVYKVVSLDPPSGGGRKSRRCWLPAGTAPTDGRSEGAWMWECVEGFDELLRAFARRRGDGGEVAE